MKNILLAIVFIMWHTSCENSLEEVPKDFISKVNFYQNESDAQKAINGVYSTLSPNYFSIEVYLMEVLHGDYLNGRGGQGPISYFDQLLDFRGINYAAACWNSFYNTINRSNDVLDNVPNVMDISENSKNRIIAEARFLRAMSYFNLVRNFGPIPIRLHAPNDFSTLEAPREPEDKVYDLIVEDLSFAEKSLPNDVGENTGKASKWAAKMLLAQVYLTLEEWEKAAEKASDIINSEVYSLVSINKPNDFYKIFATQTSSEDVMSVHHSTTVQYAVATFMHRANALPWNLGSGYYAWLPDSNSWIGNDWNDQDLRKDFNLYTHYQDGNGELVSLPSTSPILFKKFIKTPDGQSIYSIPVFRYPEALLIYAEASNMVQGGPSELALERLNMVKRRAYGYDPEQSSPVDFSSGMTKEEFRNVVLRERGYEFILERRRWYDLKRTGRVKEAFAKVGKTFIDERFFWPIPENEINNNPAISKADQNPGY
ncbi:RagB/SusD family nutrient uptake outer membrane protein [Membranihabitans maritimus]|uniref:RagB/SusD family nutrient uptake outer membrane protein n=1 Tax=Membranihabitans maritimus TaxID=2904244 RepID=UPI001F3C607F|nr:RagB/SusD family nutrient uptake outer membrane protein [Membranihabitans maritimus]